MFVIQNLELQRGPNLAEFAPPAASRSSAGVSSTRGCEFVHVCSCSDLTDEGVGARICTCLFWSFGPSRAGRCEFGRVWSSLRIRGETLPRIPVWKQNQFEHNLHHWCNAHVITICPETITEIIDFQFLRCKNYGTVPEINSPRGPIRQKFQYRNHSNPP